MTYRTCRWHPPLLFVQEAKAEDAEIQRKELALVPDSMQGVYYATLRGGLCSSYLAASVIASDMVTTSKTGAMGTVGFFCGSNAIHVLFLPEVPFQ